MREKGEGQLEEEMYERKSIRDGVEKDKKGTEERRVEERKSEREKREGRCVAR